MSKALSFSRSQCHSEPANPERTQIRDFLLLLLLRLRLSKLKRVHRRRKKSSESISYKFFFLGRNGAEKICVKKVKKWLELFLQSPSDLRSSHFFNKQNKEANSTSQCQTRSFIFLLDRVWKAQIAAFSATTSSILHGMCLMPQKCFKRPRHEVTYSALITRSITSMGPIYASKSWRPERQEVRTESKLARSRFGLDFVFALKKNYQRISFFAFSPPFPTQFVHELRTRV